jgi:hypothetical protein
MVSLIKCTSNLSPKSPISNIRIERVCQDICTKFNAFIVSKNGGYKLDNGTQNDANRW